MTFEPHFIYDKEFRELLVQWKVNTFYKVKKKQYVFAMLIIDLTVNHRS